MYVCVRVCVRVCVCTCVCWHVACGVQVIIARVAQLRTLNGSVVRPREREDAEKAYLRTCRGTFLASKSVTDGAAVDVDLFGA